ncbi:MAG: signal recognition particle protein [Chloroflexi bacterium]|nr:signal recognition particle protein [Chloroflexota bacterium]
MFDALTDKLNGVFARLGNKGRLTEADVDEALREVRMALLEADVNFRVARDFVARIRERAVGEDVLKSISPGQQVIKITNDALVEILGGGVHRLESDTKQPSVILMVGLNGAGKTTASAKLAKHLKQLGQASVLVASDLQRPAAIQQLDTLGKQVDVAVYKDTSSRDTVKVARDGVKRASELNAAWAIVDTAGRLQIDDELMKELEEVKKAVSPIETLLVVDAMTGQDAVQAAQEFHERIGLTGLILSKMDGDARGGAALSITSVTGVPIKFMGTGEGIDALEQFYPDRLASRILGMGDMLTFIEKAQTTFDETQAVELEKKIRQSTFDLEDFLGQLQQLKKMGPISQVLEMLPGFSAMKGKLPTDQLDDSHLQRTEAIIYSMTPDERRKPEMIGGSRRKRIARGSGTTPQDVNQLLNQFRQAQKMMRQLMGGGKSSKKMRRLMQQRGDFTKMGR